MRHRHRALKRRYGRFGGRSIASIEAQARADVAHGRHRGLSSIDDLYIEYAMGRGYGPFELKAWTTAARGEMKHARRAA